MGRHGTDSEAGGYTQRKGGCHVCVCVALTTWGMRQVEERLVEELGEINARWGRRLWRISMHLIEHTSRFCFVLYCSDAWEVWGGAEEADKARGRCRRVTGSV